MRTVKLTITILLALHLIVTTGLCGAACCDAEQDRSEHGVSAVKENHEPAGEEKIDSGHCPMHAAKKSKTGPQEQSQSMMARLSAASHRRGHQTGSSSTIDAHFCACSVKREERFFDALLQKPPEQRPAPQSLSGASNLAHWQFEPPPSQITSPDPSRSHSPPFRGRQLHLRI
jgi:hypothetical protein